jgi:hypothetical protein
MRLFPFSVVAAALAVAVPAPAQFAIEARFGRHFSAAVVSRHSHAAPRHDHHDHHGRHGHQVSRGHWKTVNERYLVPGYWREQHVPPTYGWITDHCGHRHWGVVDAGGCRRVWVPERWETRCRQVWVSC